MSRTSQPCIPCVLGGATVALLAAAGLWRVARQLRDQPLRRKRR